MNLNYDNKWNSINVTIKSTDIRIDFKYLTTDLYIMEHMSPNK